MSENLTMEITQRFSEELERKNLKAKPLSRSIDAHENTLGNYVRNKVPDQWVYLAKLQQQGIDIRYVLLGIDPDYSGLTSEESVLLKAYRQLSPEAQEALLGLGKVMAKESEK
ncbi:hypothetical protein I0P11_07520 [Acinetobacter baumannii]|uniref:HTH cro/C1-type domain-containing protein n=1 Tax=Acinetobacter tandoii DSM 14970 = CIP 107469 TaxID=1120927 RepID=R9AS46_9GAMM|nr:MULTISPECIES: hypothetical protein [Acinetobacter]EOR05013.1 hypothetical protein I593_03097 [Acinetobacter tandoii DSM 14970 = CIP 107469]MBF9260987.1 hypothetical protein [Acinetobacter baumannii]